jgi:hypothetical protein
VTFQTLDDKRDCRGVFYNGDFYFDKLPRNLDLTWSWSKHLEDYNVDFAELWVSGKDIGAVAPDHLRDRYLFRQRRLQAHVKAIIQSKINLDDNCIYDLVPRHILRHFYQVKNEITEWVVENYPKPKNYSFLAETQATINEISQQELQIDWDNHNLLFLQDPKAKSLYKRFANKKSNIIYNLFGTITGRLTTTPESFPIMNLKTEHRKIVMPQNDLFIELDFNAAEIRTLLALAGIKQPQDDIHKFNIEQVFKTSMSRDNAKRRFFAWLYNPDSKDEELKNYYNKEKILDKFYKNGYINTTFGRKIECDSFHSLNYLLQSTSSDNCMDRANKIRKMLSGRKSTIAFCLHDCVVLDFSNQDAHLLPQIKQVFEQTRLGKFKINLKAGKTYGSLEDFSW